MGPGSLTKVHVDGDVDLPVVKVEDASGWLSERKPLLFAAPESTSSSRSRSGSRSRSCSLFLFLFLSLSPSPNFVCRKSIVLLSFHEDSA